MPSLRSIRAKEIEKTYRDGDVIVREGDTSREMYVIQVGKVAITKGVDDREVTLATLGRGDFFGEMSLLESLPRDANALAVGDTRLLVISAGGLLLRLRRDPTFAFEMLHRLSGRIRALNAKVVRMIEDADEPEHEDSPDVMLYQDNRETTAAEERDPELPS